MEYPPPTVIEQFEQELQSYREGLKQVTAGRVDALQHQVRVFKRLDQALSQALERAQPLACREGCSYCCHYHVYVTAPEALALAEYTRKLPATRQAQIGSRLRANVERTVGMSLKEHLQTNVECAFLGADNRCTVYELRPATCRKHHAMDVQACKTTFDDPLSTDQSPSDAGVLQTGEAWIAAAAVGQREEGFDHRRYELSAAVLEALQNSASARRWKDKKKAFPSVKDVDESGGVC